MKTFTLSEALTLLPVVESLLVRAQTAVGTAAEREQQMQQLSQAIFMAGGMYVDVVAASRTKNEHEKAVAEAKDSLGELESIGVQIKDLERGLLDFPFQLEDEVVLLCWLQGEKTITHWHTTDSGFAGRRPLDDRFIRGEKPH